MKIKTQEDRRQRIRFRLRKRIRGTPERPRLAVYRSLSHIYVQVVDDMSGLTLAAASSVEPTISSKLANGVRGGNREGAEVVGRAIAMRLLGLGIEKVVFDRGGFLYHGRVKAVADAARAAGLEF